MLSLKNYLTQARDNQFALGHFNFCDSITMHGIVRACMNMRSPVFLGTSENEAAFLGYREAVALRDAVRASTAMPVFLNADHHKSMDTIQKAVDAGYDSVHIDGSALSLEENIALTRSVVEYAQNMNSEISVEGEVGYLRGASQLMQEAVEVRPQDLTTPQDARVFVDKTGVDRLAIAIGNTHGIVLKGEPPLNLARLQEINEAVADVHLTLHGGSSIPSEEIAGSLRLGITNIHVNTDIRLGFFQALWEHMQANPQETTPYKYLGAAAEAVREIVEEKLKIFGAENMA